MFSISSSSQEPISCKAILSLSAQLPTSSSISPHLSPNCILLPTPDSPSQPHDPAYKQYLHLLENLVQLPPCATIHKIGIFLLTYIQISLPRSQTSFQRTLSQDLNPSPASLAGSVRNTRFLVRTKTGNTMPRFYSSCETNRTCVAIAITTKVGLKSLGLVHTQTRHITPRVNVRHATCLSTIRYFLNCGNNGKQGKKQRRLDNKLNDELQLSNF